MDMISLLAAGKSILDATGEKMLSQQVIITAVVLWSLRSHFKKVESGLASVAETVASLGVKVSALGEALTSVEASHSERIGRLESEVVSLKQFVTKN